MSSPFKQNPYNPHGPSRTQHLNPHEQAREAHQQQLSRNNKLWLGERSGPQYVQHIIHTSRVPTSGVGALLRSQANGKQEPVDECVERPPRPRPPINPRLQQQLPPQPPYSEARFGRLVDYAQEYEKLENAVRDFNARRGEEFRRQFPGQRMLSRPAGLLRTTPDVFLDCRRRQQDDERETEISSRTNTPSQAVATADDHVRHRNEHVRGVAYAGLDQAADADIDHVTTMATQHATTPDDTGPLPTPDSTPARGDSLEPPTSINAGKKRQLYFGEDVTDPNAQPRKHHRMS